MIRVAFSQAAGHDIRSAFQWYEHRREGLGTQFLQELDRATARLETSPQAFHLERSRFRRIHLKRFPYALHFQIARRSW